MQSLAAVTPRAWVTPAIVGLNVILFLIVSVDAQTIFSPSIAKLIAWGADFGPLTVTSHQWWRLLSSCFVHIGIVHLACNLFALIQAGKLTERLFGNWFFLMIYLGSGLVGSLTSLWFNPMLVSAGASGAIFGVYGALLGYMAREKGGLPRSAVQSVSKGATVFVAYNVLYGLLAAVNQAANNIVNSVNNPGSHASGGGIDIAAHAGGLVAGLILGYLGARPVQDVERRAVARVRGWTLIFGIFAITILLLSPALKSNRPDIQRYTLLGAMYFRGEGVGQDRSVAANWMTQAAEQGDLTSQKMLGSMYLQGEGVATNIEKGLRWLTKAAEQGDPQAEKVLTGVYFRGEGVKTNAEEGAKWLTMLADHGDIEAEKLLAKLYFAGDVITKDTSKGVYWARKAAEHGDVKFQKALAAIYYKGEGVEQNKVEAAKWYLKAANQRDASSQVMVGVMSAMGDGVETNKVEALKWFIVSGSNDERVRAVRERLEFEMSADQKQQAAEEAEQFLHPQQKRRSRRL